MFIKIIKPAYTIKEKFLISLDIMFDSTPTFQVSAYHLEVRLHNINSKLGINLKK